MRDLDFENIFLWCGVLQLSYDGYRTENMHQLTSNDLINVAVFLGVLKAVVNMCVLYLISVLKGKKLSLPA